LNKKPPISVTKLGVMFKVLRRDIKFKWSRHNFLLSLCCGFPGSEIVKDQSFMCLFQVNFCSKINPKYLTALRVGIGMLLIETFGH